MRILTILLTLSCCPAVADVLPSSAGPLELSTMASGLEEPWAIAILPDESFLVTERGGLLKWFPEPQAAPVLVSGLPEVWVDGQGGLLDVMIPRDFETSREVWLTYAAPVDDGAALAVGKGVLSPDGQELEGFVRVFLSPQALDHAIHFGSRLVEATDGTIFVTAGDRGEAASAQDPSSALGKMLHLDRSGSPATVLPQVLPGVFALGLRNAQGAALDLEGRLLSIEHGPKGGDELNLIEQGLNYGWPIVTHGVSYQGEKIGSGTEAPFVTPPMHYWVPSIAPSGLMVYSGTLIPEWRGDIFYGSLNSDFLGRLDPDSPAESGFAEERIAGPATARVRDVLEAPDGSIWFLSVNTGAAYRLAPGQNDGE